MIDLNGKTVVVTGAGSGIGQGLAIKAASRGSSVAVVDVMTDGAAETVRQIESVGGTARSYQVDVTDRAALLAAAARIEDDFGGINMIFNNAGVVTGGTIMDTTPEDFDWLFDVNVRGLYNSIHAFLPALERAVASGDLAYIVNMGSENSIALPIIGPITAYTATKHAVLAITDGLRRDLKLRGLNVGVSLICPGVVGTNLWNARRTRQGRFGGPVEATPPAGGAMPGGRTVEATADTIFEGLDAGEFLIITDTRIRCFTEPRLEEISRALDVADARIRQL